MKEYDEIKAKHPDCMIMFINRSRTQVTCYQKDAKRLEQITGIECIDDVASFPYCEIDTILPKVIRAKQRVAIAETLVRYRFSCTYEPSGHKQND